LSEGVKRCSWSGGGAVLKDDVERVSGWKLAYGEGWDCDEHLYEAVSCDEISAKVDVVASDGTICSGERDCGFEGLVANIFVIDTHF